jgi:predicted sulfurtransferase
MLEEGEGEAAPLVLDIRNSYEWDIGHFEGSLRPEFTKFRSVQTEKGKIFC